MNIGIYSVSTQSGKAFLADFLSGGHAVYGYARTSDHGRTIIEAIRSNKGIYLERPPNSIGEESRFVSLNKGDVGHDLEKLIQHSEVIIIAHPAQYLEETASILKDILHGKKTPLILAPPRTMATPYLWQILGDQYPIVSFATSPYSAKSPAPEIAYIKRRKRTWMASLEGDFSEKQENIIRKLFPQALFNRVPATTSLGNIGAVFHPTTYLMNYDEIVTREKEAKSYSFYMEGIYQHPAVGVMLERIDQIRLQIAREIGIPIYGLHERPLEEKWAKLMQRLRTIESSVEASNIEKLRRIRHRYLNIIHNSVVSAQHWLDYTYGVARIPGEELGETIGRTPTYQRMSVPQSRYIDEDIPTGLVPLEALAKRLNIEHQAITDILNLYHTKTGKDPRLSGRNLGIFDTDYLVKYLQGTLNKPGGKQ